MHKRQICHWLLNKKELQIKISIIQILNTDFFFPFINNNQFLNLLQTQSHIPKTNKPKMFGKETICIIHLTLLHTPKSGKECITDHTFEPAWAQTKEQLGVHIILLEYWEWDQFKHKTLLKPNFNILLDDNSTKTLIILLVDREKNCTTLWALWLNIYNFHSILPFIPANVNQS